MMLELLRTLFLVLLAASVAWLAYLSWLSRDYE